ncbi:hypothetical protein DVQ51_09555 [Yersinia enterocolitica]|nr:hypothetical protein [Yersinia enterocolitica]EKN6155458.1 hypothetical protein [Yersinia enterocolitica]EKN6173853.1 hypothetical protein [Yersinia enterocolitica]EKN6359973.1 hypothetical protein [Yersinia enterocolitica]
MIKRFLAWLKTIYFKPASAETQTPEVSTMSDISVDVAAQPAVAVVDQVAPAPVAVAEDPTPAAEAKVGVADLDAALNFIESGVAQLGDAAKDELKALAKKYL